MKTQLIVKIDQDVKNQAQKRAQKLGLPLSTIINAYIKEFNRSKQITFSLEPEELRPEVGRLLLRASADYKAGRNISPVFATAKEMDDYLDSL